MDCPNNCDTTPYSCPIRVNADTFAQELSLGFEERDGVRSAQPSTRNGNAVLTLEIDESDYETDGHFKHRDAFESHPNSEVNELPDGRVDLVHRGASNIITAFECRECDTVYDPELGVVFDNPTKVA